MRQFFSTAALLALSALSSSALAYMSVLDTGEIPQPGVVKATGAAQLRTDQSALNVNAIMDLGLSDEYGLRGLVGGGSTDFYLGALLKWMPIPDTDGQPAIGFNAGLLFARDEGNRDLNFRFEPLVSKKFVSDQATFTPYASLPLGIRNREVRGAKNKTDLTTQFVVGTQFHMENWQDLHAIAEVGVDIADALSHISIGVVYYH
jgi:hypothetical protein